MHAERFRPLVTAKGPFASIYFDDSHDTEDAAAQRNLKWRAVREQLEREGAEDAFVSDIERSVLDSPPPVGRGGRGVIAGAQGVLLNEELARAFPTPIVRWSELPYIIPIVEHGIEHHAYLVVAVDHAGADITVYQGDDVRSETVEGGGYPVHHAHSAESSGYGDPQRTASEEREKNIRAVSERLTSLVDDTGVEVVFVIGEVRSRTDLVADLPQRVAERVTELEVGARHSGVDDEEVRRAIDTEFQRRHLATMDQAAQRFHAEIGRGSGLATQGLDGVCAALREGAVDTLIVGEIGDATVVVGDGLATVSPNPDVLSEFGAAPTATLRADEALPMLAVSTDAAVVVTDERIAPADGVGAVLRYARSQH